MLAYQLVEWQQPPVLRDVPVPEPGAGQVLVRVAGAGACHSDLHISGGHVSLVGLGGGRLPFGYGATPFETTLVMPYGGTRAELIEVLALGASGRITPHVQRFGLDQVEAVYRLLREGQIEGRAVITPTS
jgi:alcohol dehydrogenase, propanol-preferring